MSTSNLIRWSGVALMLGSIGGLAHVFTHPPGETAQDALAAGWAFSHWVGFAGSVLTMLGFVGLYARQVHRMGWLGLIGFILAFVGTFISGAINLVGSYLSPVIARHAPTWLEAESPIFSASGALAAFVLQGIGFVFGYILLAIASLRAGMLPRGASWLVIIGILVASGDPLSHIIGIVGVTLFSLGLAWMGYALWSGMGETVRQPQPVGS